MQEIKTLTFFDIEDKLRDKTPGGTEHNTHGVFSYARDLGYGTSDNMLHEVVGKRILDVTAGFGLFGYEINSHRHLVRHGTIAISVDPIHASREILHTTLRHVSHPELVEAMWKKKRRKMEVAAWTDEALPFPDETFDLVVDHNGFLLWYGDSIAVHNAFSEIKRVLKPDGEIRTGCYGSLMPNEEKIHTQVFMSLGFTINPIYNKDLFNEINGFILTK